MLNSTDDPRVIISALESGPTLGALLITSLFSMTLWGVNCTQTYDYFIDNTDGGLQRSIVALLWILDTVTSIMDSHMIYFYSVTNFTNPYSLLASDWGMVYHVSLAAISNFIIRTMFARRVYIFGGKAIFPTICIMSLSVCDLVISIILQALTIRAQTYVGDLNEITRLLPYSFAVGVAADLAVVIALTWLLQLSKTGFRRSDSLINVLMSYVVNTGLLVTIDSAAYLIAYLVMPHNMIFYIFAATSHKLYVNAYLASLNARKRIRTRDLGSSMRLSHLDASHSTSGAKISAFPNPNDTFSLQAKIGPSVDLDVS